MPLQEGWQAQGDQISKLIAKAWLDDEFKEKLTADPRATLKSEGISIPDEVELQIDESSSLWQLASSPDLSGAVYTIPLPPKPVDVTDEELTAWVDGIGSKPSAAPNCC